MDRGKPSWFEGNPVILSGIQMTNSEKREVLAEAARYAKDRQQLEWARIQYAAGIIGIKRSRLYEVLDEAKGRIRTLVLKSPGAKSGARLVHLPSFAYLLELSDEQQEVVS
jgi:hypothetical protein